MLNAKDVRLGNLVYATDGTRKQVTLEALKYLEDYPGINQATGIFIGPELLVDYGFSKTESKDVFKNELLTFKRRAFKIFFRGGVLEWIHCGTETNLRHIQYLHQLQNLYYAYYGTELETTDAEKTTTT